MVRKTIIAAALLATGSQSSAQNVRPSFQGFVLGMTRAEASAAAEKHENMKVSCNTDSNFRSYLPRPSAADQLIRFVICDVSQPDGFVALSPTVRVSTYLFLFEGKIVTISLSGKDSDSPAISSSLEGKFGKPTDIKINTLQNGFGAKIMQKESIWAIGDDQITLSSPANKVGRMTVLYTDRPASERMLKLRRAAAGQGLEM